MAKVLKFLIQRNSLQNCINKEFSWNFFNFDTNTYPSNKTNKNNNGLKNYQLEHYRKNSSNIKRQQQQHENNAYTKHNSNGNNANALLQQQKLTDSSQMQPCFIAVEATSVSVSATGCAYTSMSDAATLELKRKYHFNKLLHVRCSSTGSSFSSSSSLDQRSIFYIALLVAFYCCVLVRASSDSSASGHVSPTAAKTSIAVTPFFPNTSSSKNATTSSTMITTTSPHYAFLFDAATGDTASVADNNLQRAVVASHPADSPEAIQLHQRFERDAANVPDDDDDSSYHDDEFDEYEALINNKSAKGKYIGAPCDNNRCESTLLHVSCDKETQLCGCQKNYPVQLGLTKGCDKPKKLGEQCFYDETCIYNDENSLCVQVRHNAKCQCASGFHSVSYAKPTRRVFCTQDLKELKSDLPTLLGVSSGIAVLAGLICMVLHLFSKTKYPRHRNFGDANLPPPIMYSSETGIPLTVQSGRPSSRSSLRSSGSIGSYGNRRSSTTIQSSGHAGGGGGGGSSAGSKGILVSTSRTGSRRPSLASVHSTSSSVRSYSMMRFEKETQQKEIRHEMKLRLARLQQQQHMSQNKPQIVIGDTLVHHHGALARISMSTPSPLTPNSLDELLPSVDETQELFPIKSEPTTTLAMNASDSTSTAAASAAIATNAAYNGPCSSSTEAL